MNYYPDKALCFQIVKMAKILLLVGMALLYVSAMKFSGLSDCKVYYLKIIEVPFKVKVYVYIKLKSFEA